MSRGALCSAWQVAFNRLLYYASFQEGNMDITGADVEWSKEEFVRVRLLHSVTLPLNIADMNSVERLVL